jgi:large subunit ribosomal protein L5
MQEFQFKSQMQVPKLKKICLNQGVGDAITDKKIIETALEEMSLIGGQKAVPTKSKKTSRILSLEEACLLGSCYPAWRSYV